MNGAGDPGPAPRSAGPSPPRVAFAFGSLVLVASALSGWIEGPLSGRLDGVSAWLPGLLALLAAVACLVPSPRVVAAGGAAALALCAYSWIHLVYADARLWTLIDENDQYGEIARFSRTFLPQNLGFETEFGSEVPAGAHFDRLLAATRFLGRGWWACLAAGLWLTAGSLTSRPREAAPVFFLSLLVAGGVSAGLLVGPLQAVLYEGQGDRYVAFGRYHEALRSYEQAQRLSLQARWSASLLARLGEANARLERRDEPTAQFFMADLSLRTDRRDDAVARLEILSRGPASPLQSVAAGLLTRIRTQEGLERYREGALASAASLWERSLETEPTHVESAFFLSRAYFDLGWYERSIGMGRRVLRSTRNSIVRADTMANIGDSHTRLSQYGLAREAYQAARRLDPRMNFRVLKDLGGT